MEHREEDMQEEGATLPPFTQAFVLSVTRTRVLKAIKYAKRKTRARLRDFEEGTDKYKEVVSTLDIIEKWGDSIRDFLDDEIERITGKG